MTKIKEFLIFLKDKGLYFLTSIFFFIGYLTYILGRNRKLERTVKDLEFKEKNKETVAEQVKQDEKTNNSVANFEHLADEYLRSSPNVRDGGNSSEGSGK